MAFDPVAAFAQASPAHAPLVALLEALEDQLPHSLAGLFDGDGRIIWLSERSAARLGLVPRRYGKQRISAAQSDELAALRALVGAACEQPTASRRRPAARLLWPRERVLVRRVEAAGEPAVLLVVSRVGQEADARPRRTNELSRREAEVAELAIRGYSVANIAARLALKEQTIKTFLKRVYNKLQVRNRAELCYELLSPRKARSG